MKLKLAAAVLVTLASSGCVTSTNSYTRDIVYRDGSYYSPADEQNGDYYYEPEPDYGYYDDNYYYGSSWYVGIDPYRCRFSHYHDQYCDYRWGSSYLNFGGLTLYFGNSNYQGYGYGYPGYGYYGGYPYYGYGWYSPRPRPHANGPIPMPKPERPGNQVPDYSYSTPGMRVSGEPVRMPTKPGVLNQAPDETVSDSENEDRQNLNPYTRTRERRPMIRPEYRQEERNDRADDGIAIGNPNRQGRHTKPALLVEGDDTYQASDKPVRQDRNTQPYPRTVNSGPGREPTVEIDAADSTPVERSNRNNRQERSAPRVQTRERVERSERIERPVRVIKKDDNDRGG